MLKTVSSIVNAIGALNYKGTWDANTNTPTLVSSVGTKGDYYVVSVAGSTNLNGETNWGVGDWAVFNGSVWQKVDGGSTGNFTDITVSNSATLSYGTANGVAYLNGSKVLTTGSALTFDGTNFIVGASATGGSYRLQSSGASGNLGISIINGGNAAGDFAGLEFVQSAAQKAVIYTNSNNLTTNVKAGSNIFQLADVEQMRLTSTGLGIGTSSPGYKLQVYSNINGTPFAWGNATRTGFLYQDQSGVGITNAAGTSFDEGVYLDTANSKVVLYTNSTDRATLDSSGNLGLGVTPSAWSGRIAAQVYSVSLASPSGSPGIGEFSTNRYLASGGVDRYIYSAPAMVYQQDSGAHKWYTAPSGTAGNTISFTQAMTLDSSGNLGLGVTPSAWGSGWRALQLANGSSFVNNGATNYTGIFQNAYWDGSNNRYLSSTFALKYELVNGTHAWFNSGAGTAGNAISFTQAMTLDASGQLAIGTTTASEMLTVAGGIGSRQNANTAANILVINSNTGSNASARFRLASDVVIGNLQANSSANSPQLALVCESAYPLTFFTNNTERARIPSTGGFVVGTAALATNATTGFLYVPTCAGTPTGTPATQTGTAPIVVDTTNNKLYFYSGGQWRDAGP